MSCFICNQNDHWARKCPERTCKFCGEKGHHEDDCLLQVTMKRLSVREPAQEQPEIIETGKRPRRNKIPFSKTFDQILFDNHIVPRKTMKTDVDAFIKTNFMISGTVDEVALAIHVFTENIISFSDAGHIAVVGYIIAKYIDVSIPAVKAFLCAGANETMDEGNYHKILRSMGVTSVNRNGSTHFRKLAGYVV